MRSFLLFGRIYPLVAAVARAAPTAYGIDSHHTYPSFEADHMGISIWRGTFNTGRLTLGNACGRGTLEVDVASVDFGHGKPNIWARSAEFFGVAK